MTDFETRARAAARAVHAAVDAPADELAPRRHGRGPVRALLIAAAVIVITAIVGTTLAMRDEGAGPASDVTTFCAQVQRMIATPVDVVNGERQGPEPSLDFLRDAPEEIRPTALAILQARSDHPNGSIPIETTQRFLQWWQTRCYPNAATPNGGPTDQRDAPVPPPAGFRPCGASNSSAIGTPEMERTEYGTIAVYGSDTLADPYAGPMIGIVRSDRQRYYSDDHAVPFPVPGHPDAELIDATGPFGSAIDGLGPAITWKDDRGFVSVVGRGWSRDQAAELGALAARVTAGPSGDVLRDAADAGLSELYRGPVGEIYVQYPSPIAATTFTVSYLPERAAGQLQLYGSVPPAGAVAATRFFAPTLRPAAVGGRDVIEGVVPLTNTDGPQPTQFVVWNDGAVMLVLRTQPYQYRPSAADLDAFVRATHRLDRTEWEQLLDAGSACLLDGRGESATASGSASSNDPQSSTGSSTTSLGNGAAETTSTTGASPTTSPATTPTTTLGR